MSVAAPKLSAMNPRLLRWIYQVPFLKTAKSVLPSASKSVGANLSVEMPNCSPVNPPVEFNKYHTPFDGRNTETSALPSPSKSNGVGENVRSNAPMSAPLPPGALGTSGLSYGRTRPRWSVIMAGLLPLSIAGLRVRTARVKVVPPLSLKIPIRGSIGLAVEPS